jgi:hypothetical protein
MGQRFSTYRQKIRWMQRRLHSAHPPRRQWVTIDISGQEIRNRSAFKKRMLARRYFSLEHGDWWGWVYLTTPGVYVVHRKDRVLYVGSTATTLEDRLCSHHVISRFGTRLRDDGRTIALQDTNVISFYRCIDRLTAECLEDQLIRLFHPRYNHRNVFSLL